MSGTGDSTSQIVAHMVDAVCASTSQLDPVKCTPYVRNSAYAFTVLNDITWKSWHGRSTLPANNVVRNTILNIWYRNQADANQDIYRQPAEAAEQSLARAAAA